MPLSRSHLILIADETGVLSPIEKALQATPVSILRARYVDECLTLASAHPVSLVLADLYLSGGGGLYLVIRLKYLKPKLPSLVFFTRSNHLYDQIKDDLMTLGAAGVVTAPYDAVTTVRTIEGVLG